MELSTFSNHWVTWWAAEAEETQLARARARVVYGSVDIRYAVPQLTRD